MSQIEFVHAQPMPSSVWLNREYRWYYNPRHAPTWLTEDEAKAMIQESAKKWSVCGVLMTYVGETKNFPGQVDGINVVGWSLGMPRQLRGLTIGRAQGGQLLERDIIIRPDPIEFERSPRLLKKVITHEFGHALGLGHSSGCNDVMTSAANCPPVHSDSLPLIPTDHDLAACRALYPT